MLTITNTDDTVKTWGIALYYTNKFMNSIEASS